MSKAPFSVGQKVEPVAGVLFVRAGVVAAVGRWGEPALWWVTVGKGAAAQVVPAWKLRGAS